MSKHVWHFAYSKFKSKQLMVVYSPTLDIAISFKKCEAILDSEEESRKFLMRVIKAYYNNPELLTPEPLKDSKWYLGQCTIKCTFKADL